MTDGEFLSNASCDKSIDAMNSRRVGVAARLAVAAALAAAGGLGGCASKPACNPSTLMLTVTFDGTTGAADWVDVQVATSGGPTMSQALHHTPGMSQGTIEIDFPGGYPAGSAVAVTLTAR